MTTLVLFTQLIQTFSVLLLLPFSIVLYTLKGHSQWESRHTPALELRYRGAVCTDDDDTLIIAKLLIAKLLISAKLLNFAKLLTPLNC